MRFYQFGNGLTPLEERPAQPWKRVLALAGPDETEQGAIPAELALPSWISDRRGAQSCRLYVEQDGIYGWLHVPAHSARAAFHLAFTWRQGNMLFIDYENVMDDYVARIEELRPHDADGADNFLVDLLLQLIAQDLEAMQQLETRVSNLEQAVLNDETGGFIHQMSAVRRELNRSSRYYAQLNDFAASLQENAADLFDAHSLQRLGYFLRRVGSLREETQLLREYASQVSSEYQAQVDIAQNRIMKLLTIVTTIFMPLSLIAGWYGMNFVHMPELEWAFGYPAVIAASAIVVIACIAFFKKRHYW